MSELTIPEQIKVWDRRNAGADFRGDEPDPELVARLQNLPAKNRRALEAGCGRGRHLAWIAAQGWRATGLDWSQEALNWAQTTLAAAGQKARLVRGDLRRMPFADAEFHLVVAVRVLQHGRFALFKRALIELKRVTTPGGKVVFNVPGERNAPLSQDDAWPEPGTVVLEHGIEAGLPHHFFSEGELRQATAGWREASIERVVEPLPPGKRPPHAEHLNEWYWVTLTG